MKNILQIGTTDVRGGAALVSHSLKEHLEKNGYSCNMFVAKKTSNDPHTHSIPRSTFSRYAGLFLGTENLYKSDWILKTKEFKNADLVHLHNLHGRFFDLRTLKKMSLEKPVIWTLHDEWAITSHCAYTFEETKVVDGFFKCPSKKTPQRVLWREDSIAERKKRILLDSDFHIATPSKWLYDRVGKSFLRNKERTLIYNGIDTKSFSSTDKKIAREKIGLPQDKKIIFFLADGGASNPWKGWDYIEKTIENFNNRKDVLFVCAGNTNETTSDSHQIHYTGLISRKDLSFYYSAADVMLVTSLADNFPLVVLEALSCGLPIVSFDVGGVKEVVTHKENGYIAEYRSVVGITRGLNYILDLPEEKREIMSRASIEKIKENFSLDHMAEKYIHLYKSVIESSYK